MMKSKLIKFLAAVCLLVLVMGLFVGGAQPVAIGLFAEPWDKVAHASLFMVFAALLRGGLALPAWWALLVAALIGAGDEWHQAFLPGRTASMGDWLADLLGALLGVVLASILYGRLHRANRPEISA